jgi:hypothetical protein
MSQHGFRLVARARRAAHGLALAALLTGAGFCGTAHAERYVVVNGQRMNPAQIAYLEGLRCGPIPNGAYWLNPATGVWGYAGNPQPMGHIRDNCYGAGRRPSLSERGQLFSPRDWVK